MDFSREVFPDRDEETIEHRLQHRLIARLDQQADFRLGARVAEQDAALRTELLLHRAERLHNFGQFSRWESRSRTSTFTSCCGYLRRPRRSWLSGWLRWSS